MNKRLLKKLRNGLRLLRKQPMFKPLYNPHTLTCSIIIGDWPICEGIQKIIGFSRGWHHRNSIRLGYNRDSWESPVRLFMYAYIGGKLIDPKECVIGMFDVGTFCDLQLHSYDSSNISAVVCEPFAMPKFLHKQIINHTCKFGYLLNSYAELDGPKNEQIAFKVDIKDLKVNGKMIKI